MEKQRSASCTVMVVDDEPDIRYLLRITLEEAGYGVVEAAHGEAALELVRRSPPGAAVSMTIGIPAVPSSARSCSISSIPPIRGIIRSVITSRGRELRTRSSAASPWAASIT